MARSDLPGGVGYDTDPAKRSAPGSDTRRALFGTDLGFLLRAGKQAHQAAQQGSSAESGLTPAQFAVLLAVTRVPGSTQTHVRELAALGRTATNELIHRLADEGRVFIRDDPADARHSLLFPSPGSVAAVEAHLRRLYEAEEIVLEALGASERTALLGHMHTIAFARRTEPPRSPLQAAEVATAVARTNRAFGRLVRVCLQEHTALWHRLTPAGHSMIAHALLRVLERTPDIPQSVLAHCLLLDAASTAGLVARLRRKRLIESTVGVEDRRQRMLRLTSAGTDLIAASEQGRQEAQRRQAAPLGPDEVEELLELLARITLHCAPGADSGS